MVSKYGCKWIHSILGLTSRIYFLGVIGLWTCSRPFVPLSIVEGHEEGAVSAFAFVFDTSIAESTFSRRLTEPTSSVSPLTQFESPLQGYSRRRLSDMYSTVTNLEKEGSSRSLVLSVGRDGQCLLQDFSLGELFVTLNFNINQTINLFTSIVPQVKDLFCKCPNLHLR
jgi:hypothetical protein